MRYEQLASALGVAVGDRMPLADVRSAVLALRASKGMVLDPADPDSVSCGSFFTNPIVSENFARGLPPDTPQWLMDDDTSVKLSAAWLIEQAGVPKGFGLPGSRAAISSKHTLAITNRGGATADEVAELARYVRSVVLARFGVMLQPEPVAVGVALLILWRHLPASRARTSSASSVPTSSAAISSTVHPSASSAARRVTSLRYWVGSAWWMPWCSRASFVRRERDVDSVAALVRLVDAGSPVMSPCARMLDGGRLCRRLVRDRARDSGRASRSRRLPRRPGKSVTASASSRRLASGLRWWMR